MASKTKSLLETENSKKQHFNNVCFNNSEYVSSTSVTDYEKKIFVVILTVKRQKQPISSKIQKCMISMVHQPLL